EGSIVGKPSFNSVNPDNNISIFLEKEKTNTGDLSVFFLS
ncbi:unnamed protein product, partial [marine sediment metagenome]